MKNKIYCGLLLVFLISAIFVACSRPADILRSETVPISQHQFTRAEVTEIIITNNFNIIGLHLADSSYASPDKDWVTSAFSEKLSKFLFDYNINHWTKESSDCDKITRAAAFYAGVLFHNSNNRISGRGFLVGELHYMKSGKSGHAINIWIVKDGSTHRILFYDPQLKFEVSLTDGEKQSAFLIKI